MRVAEFDYLARSGGVTRSACRSECTSERAVLPSRGVEFGPCVRVAREHQPARRSRPAVEERASDHDADERRAAAVCASVASGA